MNAGFDVSQLEEFRDKLVKLQTRQDEICKTIVMDLALRAMRDIIKNTPVGNYDDGRRGGALRQGWAAQTEGEAIESASPNLDYNKFSSNLKIEKQGNNYVATISNVMNYASYVEYGHRKVKRQGDSYITYGWQEGVFMMTIAIAKVDSLKDRIIERSLDNIFKEMGF